jgi:Smg protein
MFDVLVYLFETYYAADQTPDQDTLTRRLSQAGFENDDISDALDWLSDLTTNSETRYVSPLLDESRALRADTRGEQAKLSRDTRGFLNFFESAGLLAPRLRELIIERSMALDVEQVPLEQFKVIVLMVMWTQQGNLDSLVLEELLPDGAPRQVH